MEISFPMSVQVSVLTFTEAIYTLYWVDISKLAPPGGTIDPAGGQESKESRSVHGNACVCVYVTESARFELVLMTAATLKK